MQRDTEIKMTEINKNIANFAFGAKKIEAKKAEKMPVNNSETKDNEQGKYILDNGVIGRSQVSVKGGDMTKSIDEAVALARTNPLLLGCSETFFDAAYTNFQTQGMSAEDAYFNALLASDEFFGLAQAHV